jgi:hypothetical protein
LDLSDLAAAVDAFWQQTAADGTEHGACVVQAAAGRALDHEVRGTPGAITPAHRVGDHADHVGFFHTHPSRPDGSEQWGFSETDLAAIIEEGCRLSVVRNGAHVFAVVRPPGVPSRPVTPAEEADFVRTFVECRQQISDPAGAEREANRRLCGLLGLWLYAGPAGQPLPRAFP